MRPLLLGRQDLRAAPPQLGPQAQRETSTQLRLLALHRARSVVDALAFILDAAAVLIAAAAVVFKQLLRLVISSVSTIDVYLWLLEMWPWLAASTTANSIAPRDCTNSKAEACNYLRTQSFKLQRLPPKLLQSSRHKLQAPKPMPETLNP